MGPRAGGVASLNHLSVNDSMKGDAVVQRTLHHRFGLWVVPGPYSLRQTDEYRYRLRRVFLIQLCCEFAFVGLEESIKPGFKLRRLRERCRAQQKCKRSFHCFRMSDRNSSRVSFCSRNAPSMVLVTVPEFCFSTPRIIMQKCCASTITPTPTG